SLLEELTEGGRSWQQNMIVSRQLNKVCAWDDPRHKAALLKWRDTITLAMKHQSGNAHLFCQLANLHSSIHFPKPQRVLSARGHTLELVKARRNLRRGVGHETRSEELPEDRIGRSPAVTDRHGQGVVELLLIGVGALESAAKVAAQQHETGHPVRVLHGVAD